MLSYFSVQKFGKTSDAVALRICDYVMRTVRARGHNNINMYMGMRDE
jgi:hypothetical protein